eukprot:COSAG01_NODE_2290_length_7984_cov_10.803424_11_plen_84_part_00
MLRGCTARAKGCETVGPCQPYSHIVGTSLDPGGRGPPPSGVSGEWESHAAARRLGSSSPGLGVCEHGIRVRVEIMGLIRISTG